MEKLAARTDKHRAANMRIGYMAGWTSSHWAAGMLLGGSSSGRKSIGQDILPETFYLYRALVAGQTQQ
jgi:hypothetical protein